MLLAQTFFAVTNGEFTQRSQAAETVYKVHVLMLLQWQDVKSAKWQSTYNYFEVPHLSERPVLLLCATRWLPLQGRLPSRWDFPL